MKAITGTDVDANAEVGLVNTQLLDADPYIKVTIGFTECSVTKICF